MNRPQVTLKLATSLDGKIATGAGESRWITGAEARAEVHRMRAANDAVLVGIGTVLADDPELTARTEPPPARQPLRVVLDRQWRLPLNGRLAQTAHLGAVAVISTAEVPTRDKPSLAGVEFVSAVSGGGEGEIATALRVLAERYQIANVMVEGGGMVAAAFLRERLVDRLEWFRAPIVIGGEGRGCVGALELEALASAPRFNRVAVQTLGADLWERYERA